MSEKLKKILFIIGFILAIIALSFLIYFVFFKTEIKDNVIIDSTEEDISQPNLIKNKDQSIIKITPEQEKELEDNFKDGVNTGKDPETLLKELFSKYKTQDIKNSIELPTKPQKNIDIINEKEDDVARGGVTKSNLVVNYKNLNPISKGNNLVVFNKDDGYFYKIDSENNIASLYSTNKFKGATEINWAPNGDKAIIGFPDGTNITYDFVKEKQYTLPKSWYDFSFQKDGDKIAFMIDSENYKERWLSVSSPDGSSFTPVEPLGNNADKVLVAYSPNEQMIALSRTGEPLGIFRQQVIPIGKNKENFKALEIEGRNFNPLWSPKGDKLVYDVYSNKNDFKPMLYVVNATSDKMGTGQRYLEINTWVSKCTFDSSGVNLYCAVPRSLPDGAGMYPDSVDNGGYYDDIYKINIYTLYRTIVAKPNIDVSIENMSISSDDKMLYYKDKSTGFIYSMKLK